MPRSLTVCGIASLCAVASAADLLEPIFYLPLDGSTTAAIARGEPRRRATTYGDPILTLLAEQRPRFGPGKVGPCYEVEDRALVFEAKGNFRPDEGTCAFWVNPNFRGDSKEIYCTFFGAEKWGMLYKYMKHTSLTLGTAKPERDLYYDCGVRDISLWRPGQWHHVAATWSRRENARRIYVDGELEAQAPFPFHRALTGGPLFIGGGCLLYPQHIAHAKLDEVAIWDRVLDGESVAGLCERGMRGEPIRASETVSRQGDCPSGTVPSIDVGQQGDSPQGTVPSAVQSTSTRSEMRLDGWWHFLPSAYPLDVLPAEGWGTAVVPGYYTSPGTVKGPDGKPARGRWRGQGGRPQRTVPDARLSDLGIAYYQRSFVIPEGWRGKAIFLHFDGVDGLATICVNGQRVGRLLCWEYEDYGIADLVKYGEWNVVTIALRSPGDGKASGIHGSVSVRAMAKAFVRDIVVRPRVVQKAVEFSCDLWRQGEPADCRLAFEVAPVSTPDQTAKRFEQACRLTAVESPARDLTSTARRIECTFAWPEARPWTYDDPHLYVVRAKLYVGGQLIDESRAYRFGFREFAMKGSDFFLNGVPTHLRGHQINLAWANQLEWMHDFKAAGMNCVEVSGPIRHSWRGGMPYKRQLFEEILSFADENGIIAIPLLPAARVLKDRVFDPGVARLYRRRAEKHIRLYGNHPSVCMWFMNFNLAGYRWYHPPTKIDGSYKPDDAQWQHKERYSLEAQRIVQTIDPRPVYHHACGNFGDIYTLNCYIGPTSPIQEREEWPSRWAEKRPFPLIACEHGLWLVPYWYRPRQFPLSVGYGDEPIFDEWSAMVLGPRAYGMVTPELIEIYGLGEKRQRERLKQLVSKHAGYQEVKSLIARHSLRAWRTYGVSGIIYNALQWDFRDGNGNPSTVMRSQQRYFNHSDFYIAGPEGDLPSKDHAYWAGERVRKQLVLLNDLTHDVEDTLCFEVRDLEGQLRSGRSVATRRFRAGVPTFVPLSYGNVEVPERTDFIMTVRSEGRPGLEDSIRIQFFPRSTPLALRSRIVLFDPVGRTKEMLDRTGVPWEAYSKAIDLAATQLAIVGRECFGEEFAKLAEVTKLEDAVAAGLNLLVFEQTKPMLGLKLTERSTRRAFIAWRGHPALDGLMEEDFSDLRGGSDLVEPYPEAAPETQKKWPKRYFKWGNRGVVATYLIAKPHYGPYVPILQSGFDLVESPLMEARIGKGRIVLCQVDVTSRYGADPVSTLLVDNLLRYLTQRTAEPEQYRLLSVSQAVEAEGLVLESKRFSGGKVGEHPLLAGLGDGDLYLKLWHEGKVAREQNGWQVIAEPGLVAVKQTAKGRVVACTLDPETFGETRARLKALRFRSILRSNLGSPSISARQFIFKPPKLYEPNEWEEMPGYINW